MKKQTINIVNLFLIISAIVFTQSCSRDNSTDDNNRTTTNAELITSTFYDKNDVSTYLIASSLLADNSGNKWICYSSNNSSGIIRYNGLTWEKFIASNTNIPFLYSMNVYCEDSEGGVYFITENSNADIRYLIKFKNGSWNYWSITDVIQPKKVFFNPADNLLYFYYSKTIKRAAINSDFSKEVTYSELNTGSIRYSLIMDCGFTNSTFYITSESESVKVSSNSAITLTPIDGSNFRKVITSKSGQVYALTNNNSILKLSGTKWDLFPVNLGNGNNITLTQLSLDNNGTPFIYTFEKGIGKIVNGVAQYYSVNGEPIITYSSIAVDKNNVKWITSVQGLIKITE